MLQSIRSRLITLVLAVALPLFGLLVWVFWAEVSRVHDSARDLALRIAVSISEDIRDSNTRSQNLLLRMSKRPKIRHVTPGECDSLFAIVDFFPQYLNLVLFDPSGKVICTSTPSAADAPFTAAAEPIIAARLRGARARELDTLILPINGKWISVAFLPITEGGVTTEVLALEQYLDLDVTAFPNGTVLTLVDGRGRILGRSPDGPSWVGRDFRAKGVGRLPLQNGAGRAEAVGIDGALRQYGFTRVEGTDWIMYVGIPAGIARAAVRVLIARGIIAGLVICAVVLLLALRLAATIKSPLDVLAHAAQRVGEHGFSGRIPAGGPREVAVVGQAFNRMIESRSDAEKALIDSRAQLEALSKKLLDVQEEERSRISREIHDELGQLLTALKMDIGGLLDTGGPWNADQRGMIRRIRQALAQTLSSVQRISAELRPAALDDFGLVAAIESEVRVFEERTGVECDLSIPDENFSLGSEADAAIYRIVQEAMTNVARHSDATRLEIRLRHRSGELLVEIRDDGKGIAPEKLSDRASLGIAGMRERARRIGAVLEIEGIEGHGTIVSLRLPAQRVEATAS